MSTIFTKINIGEIPCYKIYEDEHTFAFLAKDQVVLGHTLIVPKVEVDYFVDVPEPYFSAVFSVSKEVAKAIQKATECKRVGTIIAGFDVPHFHYHLIPTYSTADLDFGKAKEYDQETMEGIQKRIVKFFDN